MTKIPLADIKEKVKDLLETRDFKRAITRKKGKPLKLIAEIKKASPSRGIIREDFDPERIALIYEEKGAAAISVLTEGDFFKGSLSDLRTVREKVPLPLLRKDFVFDPYQVYESRLHGADAVLLIASILERSQIEDLMGLSEELGMDCLVEVHNSKDLDKALMAEAEMIGINNRNLETFETDINVTIKLIKDVPQGKIIVSESGISAREDVERLEEAGVKAVLVGEALIRSRDIGGKIKELMGR